MESPSGSLGLDNLIKHHVELCLMPEDHCTRPVFAREVEKLADEATHAIYREGNAFECMIAHGMIAPPGRAKMSPCLNTGLARAVIIAIYSHLRYERVRC